MMKAMVTKKSKWGKSINDYSKVYNAKIYLDLLRQTMWMTLCDVEVVADTYQKTIHIPHPLEWDEW